ncbi:leucyl aminopeptidase [Caldimonas brevitalea]|uniref:Probable cytosol aminopeptidase n=1 Tax=Caldimonas brevitalea TaxID=413882 RepID=A0A0G3BK94_9BURK|nr:leucyl aminopeptidase [Caldimonas brevitalea]AKJ29797.1 cytosol aminopeptidase [Caldimonas brevitalea]
MDFRFLSASRTGLADVTADALVVIVAGESAEQGLEGPLAQHLKDVLSQRDFVVKAGRTFYLHKPQGVRAPRVVFAAASDASSKAFRSAVGHALTALKNSSAKHVAIALAGSLEMSGDHAEALVAAVTDATYVYRHTKPSALPPGALSKVTLLGEKADTKVVQQGLARGQAIAAGVTLARECANRPGNHCTPTYLAEQAQALARDHGLKVEVLDRKAVEKLGMGSFLAVAKGSDEPLRFIVLRYEGAARNQAPLVLVGKGITFDTGGISIKPSAEMDEMKFDMGGAASVLGTFRAVADLKPKINLVGLIPACENMPDGRAVKPGDVVTSLSGQTIEILNTDAEGRLILCDALSYAERFKPAAVVDIATLTGACVVALGHHRSGLFTADDELADLLLRSGQKAQDPCWRMPLDEEYEEALKSNFADMGNVGGRAGGAITAAMFLRKFTAKYRWAHLDIAGTAWKGGAAKGATGRPVPLLTHFVLSQAR